MPHFSPKLLRILRNDILLQAENPALGCVPILGEVTDYMAGFSFIYLVYTILDVFPSCHDSNGEFHHKKHIVFPYYHNWEIGKVLDHNNSFDTFL